MSDNLNIRQRLNRSRLSPDTRLLVEEGLEEISGLAGQAILTDMGRRVADDIRYASKTALSGEAVRKEMVAQVKNVRKQEKDEKKS